MRVLVGLGLVAVFGLSCSQVPWAGEQAFASALKCGATRDEVSGLATSAGAHFVFAGPCSMSVAYKWGGGTAMFFDGESRLQLVARAGKHQPFGDFDFSIVRKCVEELQGCGNKVPEPMTSFPP